MTSRYLKLSAMVAGLMGLAACSGNEYIPGDPDRDDSYNVYFDAGQSTSVTLKIDEESSSCTFTLTRENTDGDIVVPLVLKGDTDVFACTELYFEDGNPSSEVVVTFEAPEFFHEYVCDIVIEDPLYAKLYGQNETSVTLKVTRNDYEQYAEGIYTTHFLQSAPGTPASYPVKVYYSPILDQYEVRDAWTVPGYSLPFVWPDQGTEVAIIGSSNTGQEYDAGIYIMAEADPDPERISSYDASSKTFTFWVQYRVPNLGTLIINDPDKLVIQN